MVFVKSNLLLVVFLEYNIFMIRKFFTFALFYCFFSGAAKFPERCVLCFVKGEGADYALSGVYLKYKYAGGASESDLNSPDAFIFLSSESGSNKTMFLEVRKCFSFPSYSGYSNLSDPLACELYLPNCYPGNKSAAINVKRKETLILRAMQNFNQYADPAVYCLISSLRKLVDFSKIRGAKNIIEKSFGEDLEKKYQILLSSLGLFSVTCIEHEPYANISFGDEEFAYFLSMFSILESLYLNSDSKRSVLYEALFFLTGQKFDELVVLDHIRYANSFDYAKTQFFRIFLIPYDQKLLEINEALRVEKEKIEKRIFGQSQSLETYSKEHRENRVKKMEEAEKASLGVKLSLGPGCAAGFDVQAPAAAAGGRTGVGFDAKLVEENMESTADSKVSGYSKLQPRKPEIISFYSFLLPKKYSADKADQFFSHFKIEPKKFYDMIEDVLEKDAKAKKKKAKKIEARIEDFFGQSVFNKGSARHYKVNLANKEYDLYLHKDHAGSQGWQTSASYALIYFLNSLKEDFEAATSDS